MNNECEFVQFVRSHVYFRPLLSLCVRFFLLGSRFVSTTIFCLACCIHMRSHNNRRTDFQLICSLLCDSQVRNTTAKSKNSYLPFFFSTPNQLTMNIRMNRHETKTNGISTEKLKTKTNFSGFEFCNSVF